MASNDFDSYISDIVLSEVKHKLLHRLWGEVADDVFPKPWVKSSELLELSNQKYFDRRLRELRDEEGLDIESLNVGGEHSWRIGSAKKNGKLARTYLDKKAKDTLFANAKNECQICGKAAKPGVMGLQADHRIPLIRGGGDDISNWQAICNECNVVKRRSCQGCGDQCQQCGWAFPEKLTARAIVTLTSEQLEEIKNVWRRKPSLSKDELFNTLINLGVRKMKED